MNRKYWCCDFGKAHPVYSPCSCYLSKTVDMESFRRFKRMAGVLFNQDIKAFDLSEFMSAFLSNPHMGHDSPMAREMQDKVMKYTQRRRKL